MQCDVMLTMTTTIDVMLLLTTIRAVGATHFHGAHFWFEPANNWTPRRLAVS